MIKITPLIITIVMICTNIEPTISAEDQFVRVAELPEDKARNKLTQEILNNGATNIESLLTTAHHLGIIYLEKGDLEEAKEYFSFPADLGYEPSESMLNQMKEKGFCEKSWTCRS